jgi:uncharacterized protein YkwD
VRGFGLAWLLVLAAALVPAPAPATRTAPCSGASLTPTRANTSEVNAATLCLVNRERHLHHLRPLRSNRYLQSVAARQVHSMVHENYFADDGPYGQTPKGLIGATAYAAHAASLTIAENIGWGTGVLSTPGEMVLAWMRSPAHRAIILTGKFLEAGVDVTAAVPSVLAVNPPGATYAIEFGERRPAG